LDYFKKHDALAKSLTEVKQCIDKITTFATTKGYRVFWRGQANHEWGLTSSLVRQLTPLTAIDDDLLNRVEQELLDEATGWITELGQAPYSEPLAKLAYLQHHGIPTRLLDFTSDPWKAVFFSADSHDHVDGRVFALMVANADVIGVTPAGTPWRDYSMNEVKIYDPSQAGVVFPRLVAQGGVLAVGRLPSTQPYREVWDDVIKDSRGMLAEEVRRVLSIPFKLSPFKPGEAQPIDAGIATPIGLTFRVHVDKSSIRRDLAGAPGRISPGGTTSTHKSVYPDAAGMATHSTIIQGLRKGVLVLSE